MGARIILAIFIVVGCTLAGKSMSAALRRRLTVLDQMIHSVKMLRIHMSGMLESVERALEITNFDAFAKVSQEMTGGLSAQEAWTRAKEYLLRRGGYLDALAESDVSVIDGLFEDLGQMSRQTQEVRFQNILKNLAEQREAARLIQNERERLYVTVGFLLGIMLALVVI